MNVATVSLGRSRWSSARWSLFGRLDELLAISALMLMLLIPLIEILARPMLGRGIENAPVLVQHLGLVMAMFGAIAAERHGHLVALGSGLDGFGGARFKLGLKVFSDAGAALICGLLASASWRFVASEMSASHALAYGLPVWAVQAVLPVGFTLLGAKLAGRCVAAGFKQLFFALPLLGFALGIAFDGSSLPILPAGLGLLALLLAGAPIFAVLGGLALALFWQDGLPLASVALSHYQITVNPSLPALPLFTLAGLILARTGAARRLSAVFLVLFGSGARGTVIAAAVLCSLFTAFTGGSGVTILALGGLLLPMLRNVGFPEQRGISLVTSASALGVLLAPSVPLIMYAIIARVPINTMFLAGLLPACVMVAFLLVFGGYLKRNGLTLPAAVSRTAPAPAPPAAPAALWPTLWHAKWELLTPLVAVGSLIGGFTTPTESAALTAAYALLTQAFAHRELTLRVLGRTLTDCAQIIGGVMLILGMALGLTNYLIDAGIPDLATEWVQHVIPNKFVFLLVLNLFLFAAGAMMEIFAAIVVLVPLLLPVAMSYGIDPVHFGIIFLANMEMGFLCPPAGMNIYFASAMFGKSVRYVAVSVLPALLAIFLCTLVISWLPLLSTGLPDLVAGKLRG